MEKKSGCTMYTLLGRIVKRELPFLNRISPKTLVTHFNSVLNLQISYNRLTFLLLGVFKYGHLLKSSHQAVFLVA